MRTERVPGNQSEGLSVPLHQVSCWGVPPADGIDQISRLPSRVDEKIICFPSGLHTGSDSHEGWSVNRRARPPSMEPSHRSPSQVNATRSPWGEMRGECGQMTASPGRVAVFVSSSFRSAACSFEKMSPWLPGTWIPGNRITRRIGEIMRCLKYWLVVMDFLPECSFLSLSAT